MDRELIEKILIGVISGGISFAAGLVTPWVKWKIEERRERNKYRKEAIAMWREAITKRESRGFFSENQDSFGNSAAYSSLRSHMRAEIIKKVEASRTIYVPGGRGGSVEQQWLLDEVTRLEREWKLI